MSRPSRSQDKTEVIGVVPRAAWPSIEFRELAAAGVCARKGTTTRVTDRDTSRKCIAKKERNAELASGERLR